ncbi:alpha/beta hydrolase fold domain-containing protein [Nocardia neocaledoniensis]|uniref:alpha/beta hydrolase fold domain-containing protein n=1 Tax=Nocardia neocaledoniensis TaxID=236511 RepID=UPI003CC7DD05
MLWLHGGAFLGGGLDMPESHAVCTALASRGTTCVGVDYRLAPNFGDRRAQRVPDAVR